MPIDIEKESAASGCVLTKLRQWSHLDHEVALVRYEKKDADPPYAHTHLVCECDFDVKPVVRDGKTIGVEHVRDPEKCASKDAVRALVKLEMKRPLLATLRASGLKAAILEAHAKVKAGEYLGQRYACMIYAQEVAELLEVGMTDMHPALAELFAEEKIDLNGMILADYVPRFRFPREIQQLFRMLVEAPLGWPNGDAGDCFLATVEGAIHEGTDFKHGKDAFWPHNFPHLAASHLVEFGHHWLASALARAERGGADREDLRFTDCEWLAADLERLAAGYRALGKAHGFPQNPLAGQEAKKAPAPKKRRSPKKRR